MPPVVKNLPANAGDVREVGSTLGSGDPWKWQPTLLFLPGESSARGAWWATVHGVAELDTTKYLSTAFSYNTCVVEEKMIIGIFLKLR